MKKKILSFLLVLSLLVTLIVPFTVTTASADGNAITNQTELAGMSASGNYYLANDITISGTWDYSANQFTGTFDGKGHTIFIADGATLKGGIFNQIGGGAIIKDLTINQLGKATYTLGQDYQGGKVTTRSIGVLAGSCRSNWDDRATARVIKNVTVYADVATTNNDYNIGGLVGKVEVAKTIFDGCAFYGSVTNSGNPHASRAAGGIVGAAGTYINGLLIKDCINYGTITTGGLAGGIFGAQVETGGVENASGVGTVTIDGKSYAYGDSQIYVIDGCVNYGSVSAGSTYAGGIAAKLFNTGWRGFSVNYNINYGVVKTSASSAFVGGIAGYYLSNRYNEDPWMEVVGNVNYGACAYTAESGTVLPILAYSNKVLDNKGNNYCNTSTANGSGTNTPTVTVISTSAETDSAITTLNGVRPGAVCKGVDGRIATTKWQSSSTSAKISSQANLAAMSETGNYYLDKDITISGTWNFFKVFKGTLNGNGHKITFEDGTIICGGLFRNLSLGATIENLDIEVKNVTWKATRTSAGNIFNSANSIGSLAAGIFGKDEGGSSSEGNKITVQNVTATANISVSESSGSEVTVGGLIGQIRYTNALIERCKFNGSITVSMTPSSNSAFGGIVGMIPRVTYRVEITKCINEADINAPCNVGGILGWSRYWYDSKNDGGEENKWALKYGIQYLSVDQCMNRGAITCTGSYSGGEGYKDVGGIIGYALGVNKSETYVRNNINYGAVSFTGSAEAYPGGICGRVRYNNGAMVFEGNINYGSLSVVVGTTAPILNWNENAYRLNGTTDADEVEYGEIQHQNNYAVAGRVSTSGAQETNDGQMKPEIIKGSSYNAFTALKSVYPDIYTMNGSGKISLMWESGDLSYQAADSYSTQMSLALDGTIQMRIGVGASCVVPDDKGVTLTVEKDSTSTSYSIYDVYDAASGYFIVSFPLTAKEMADSHTYKVTIKEGSTTIKSSEFTKSVKDYANAILADENYSDWHSLMTAMLNYGAAAQNYFEYNAKNLAGSTNITFSAEGLPSVTQVSGDASIIDHVSGSMNLNSGTDLNLYVKPTTASNILTATVKNSSNITVENVPCTKLTSGDLNGYWLIKIPNLSADQLNETFNITVSNGSKNVVFSYSALCWIKAVLNTEDVNVTEAMKVLAKGIGAYAVAAAGVSDQNQPLMFASQGISPYAVSYTPSASDYLKSTALSVAKNLNEDDVKISATTAPAAGQRVVELKTDSTVSNYKIEFASNGDVIITGNDDRWTALGALEFFNVLLKKNSNGDYVVSNPQTYTPSNAANYTRSGWLLAAPAYASGTLSSGMYDDGTGLSADKNAPDAERSYMMSISGTSVAQFTAYRNRLTQQCGYTLVASNTNSSNQFYQYKKGNQLLYCYYINSTKVVRVIEDRASTPEDEFEDPSESSSSTATELCMYGLKYTSDGYTINNGAFNIIKQADGSVILIDGGKAEQATDDAVTGLWNYLLDLTGVDLKKEDEKVKIACWFVTHPHGDHYAMVSALIEKYHEFLDLQRVMFNFPNAEVVGTHVIGTIRDAARQYFPDTMFLKCHTGQKIKLGTLTMNIMTAQEDLVDPSTGTTGKLDDGNLLTSVCRFDFADGTKYMELGDFDESRQTALLNMYNASEFACKVTSVAHHGYNVVSSLYAKIGARYAFFPNYVHTNFNTSTSFGDGKGSWRKEKCSSTVSALKSANSSVEIFYAGSNTVKLTCANGNITKSTSSVVY